MLISQQPVRRPLMKGMFHLFAAIAYILATPVLIAKIPPGLEYPLTLYIISVIANFGSSALFHVIKWPKSLIIYPRRLDHIMIFVKIAATYYAVICTILFDVSSLVIYVLIVGTTVGILTRIFFTKAPKIVIGLPYILMGWAILLDPYVMIKIIEEFPTGSLMIFIAGMSYTVGACVYIARYPKGWLPYVGYHELFHMFTVIGAGLLTVTIFEHGIPYYLSNK